MLWCTVLSAKKLASIGLLLLVLKNALPEITEGENRNQSESYILPKFIPLSFKLFRHKEVFAYKKWRNWTFSLLFLDISVFEWRELMLWRLINVQRDTTAGNRGLRGTVHVNQHGTDMGVWYITKELVLDMQDALSLHKWLTLEVWGNQN